MILIDSQPPSVWSTVIPVITLVIGWALGFLTELWKGRHDRAAKALERQELRIAKRSEFQRENLLALQEAINEVMQGVNAVYAHHVFLDTPIPEPTFSNYLLAKNRLLMLHVRINDEGVRKKAKEVWFHCSRADHFRGKEASGADVDAAIHAVGDLHEFIGKLLRELDALDERIS